MSKKFFRVIAIILAAAFCFMFSACDKTEEYTLEDFTLAVEESNKIINGEGEKTIRVKMTDELTFDTTVLSAIKLLVPDFADTIDGISKYLNSTSTTEITVNHKDKTAASELIVDGEFRVSTIFDKRLRTATSTVFDIKTNTLGEPEISEMTEEEAGEYWDELIESLNIVMLIDQELYIEKYKDSIYYLSYIPKEEERNALTSGIFEYFAENQEIEIPENAIGIGNVNIFMSKGKIVMDERRITLDLAKAFGIEVGTYTMPLKIKANREYFLY